MNPDDSRFLPSRRCLILLWGALTVLAAAPTMAQDSDGDGTPDLSDNCVNVSNPFQIDGDGDATGDVCDCAPDESGNAAVLGPATDLMFSSKSDMSWTAPVDGGVTTYDLLRVVFSTDEQTCVETDIAALVATDLMNPGPNELFLYAPRAENGCGGNLGASSDEQRRWARGCPLGGLADCTETMDGSCPDGTGICSGVHFNGGLSCSGGVPGDCADTGSFAYRVTSANPLTIDLDEDVISLDVFFSHETSTVSGAMRFFDADNIEVDPLTDRLNGFGDMEQWNTATNLTRWNETQNGGTTNQETSAAEVRTGSNALRFDVVNNGSTLNINARNGNTQVALPEVGFYRLRAYVKGSSPRTEGVRLWVKNQTVGLWWNENVGEYQGSAVNLRRDVGTEYAAVDVFFYWPLEFIVAGDLLGLAVHAQGMDDGDSLWVDDVTVAGPLGEVFLTDPVTSLGPCGAGGSMPAVQQLDFSRPVRRIEVTASGSGDVWIDSFNVNPRVPLATCTETMDSSCPDTVPECAGVSFSGGLSCQMEGLGNCSDSGTFAYKVTPASPVTINFTGGVDRLEVFLAHEAVSVTGVMSFFDGAGLPVDFPITSLGPCGPGGSMPAKQVVDFSRSVYRIEVIAAGVGNVWIDSLTVNP